LEWNYSKDGSVSTGMDCGFLDDINIPAEVFRLSINEGVDNNYLEFSTGGDAVWHSDPNSGENGGDCVVSGNIDDNENSFLSTYLHGPGNISFSWKVSSERGSDFLSFYIDGDLVGQISGNASYYSNYYNEEFDLDPGNHTLMWVYSKNENISKGSDSGWIDVIRFARDDIAEWLDLNLLDFQFISDSPIKNMIWTLDKWKECNISDLSFYDDDCVYANEGGICELTLDLEIVEKMCIEYWWNYEGSELNTWEVFNSFNGVEDELLEEWNHADNGEYRRSEYKLNPGRHIITWRYTQKTPVEEDQGAFLDKMRIFEKWSLRNVYVAQAWIKPEIIYPPGHHYNPIIGDINTGIQRTISDGVLNLYPGSYYFDDYLEIYNDITIKSVNKSDFAKITPIDGAYYNNIWVESNDVKIRNIEFYNIDSIDISSSDNFEMEGCYLEEVALFCVETDNLLIHNCTFKDDGISIAWSNNVNISNNEFDGVDTWDDGIVLYGEYHRFPLDNYYTSNYTITYNKINNYDWGIAVYDIINLEISHNEIKDNYGVGIRLEKTAFTRVFNNNIMNNGQYLNPISKNVYFLDSNVHFFRNYWEPKINLIYGENMINGLYFPIIKIGFPRFFKNDVEW